jgi:hypothetical protein
VRNVMNNSGHSMTGAFAVVLIINMVAAIAFIFKNDFHRTVPSKKSWILPICTSLLFFAVTPNAAIAFGCLTITIGFRAIAVFFTTGVQRNLSNWIGCHIGCTPKKINRYAKKKKRDGDHGSN